MKNRIHNEICNLYEKYNNIQATIHPTTNIHTITIHEKNQKIVFHVNESVYPFRPPNHVYINDILYRDYIKTPPYLVPFLKKIGNEAICFCCDTILTIVLQNILN